MKTCKTCGYITTKNITECPECNEMHGGLVEAKPARLLIKWNGAVWEYNVRAGERGTGKVIASATSWDNDMARGKASEIVHQIAEDAGYAILPEWM